MATKPSKTAKPPKLTVEPPAPIEAVIAPAVPPYPEFASFGRENLEAVATANAAVSAGVEAISQEFMTSAKASFEGAGETVRALLGARTIQDVVQLQSDFAKAQFDRLMHGSAKLTELGCSMVEAALAPWGSRVAAGFVPMTSVWGKPTA